VLAQHSMNVMGLALPIAQDVHGREIETMLQCVGGHGELYRIPCHVLPCHSVGSSILSKANGEKPMLFGDSVGEIRVVVQVHGEGRGAGAHAAEAQHGRQAVRGPLDLGGGCAEAAALCRPRARWIETRRQVFPRSLAGLHHVHCPRSLHHARHPVRPLLWRRACARHPLRPLLRRRARTRHPVRPLLRCRAHACHPVRPLLRRRDRRRLGPAAAAVRLRGGSSPQRVKARRDESHGEGGQEDCSDGCQSPLE